VIRTDVLVSSPIFLVGLAQTLTDAGIKVVAVRSSADEKPSWLADAIVVDADAISPSDRLDHVAEAATCAPVLVLDNAALTEYTRYFRAGASGVLTKRESGEQVVRAVRAITSGARVCPAGAAGPPVVPRTEVDGCQLSEREEQVLLTTSCWRPSASRCSTGTSRPSWTPSMPVPAWAPVRCAARSAPASRTACSARRACCPG
jgi:DNA-binding NarL/FixJ family response regulator